jgi:serine/threonine-protein kinase
MQAMSASSSTREPTSTPSLSEAPAVIAGRYEILGMLGVGGMGCVYKARDQKLDEVVALKVLRREIVGATGMLERFRREVKLARRVTHRNVARAFDLGEHEGETFFTMEYVEGSSLATLVANDGRLALARVVDVACAICAGLSAAHAAGVVHRDLKPDNVLVGKDGRIVVTDFGIARAASAEGGSGSASDASATAGMILGTPAYMAPEQVEGAPDVDARADIYALGAMLFELVTGEPAWRGDSPVAVASARLFVPPPDPRSRDASVPDGVARLVLRCMARRREDRPASVEHVATELSGLTLPAPLASTARERPSNANVAAAAPAALPAVPSPRDRTLAVLPFRGTSDPADDYISDGLTEDLIDALSMTKGLRVRSRAMVMRHKGAAEDALEIGRKLDAEVLVEGSVRKAGDALRVTVRLVSVSDGLQLWAKRFDRPAAQALAVTDEAAQAIAAALTIDSAREAREAPGDPAAIDLYLRARHAFRKYRPGAVAESVALFQQALQHAPEHPTILSGYALAQARHWFYTAGSRGADAGELARRAAERAIAAAPTIGEPYIALAWVQLHSGDIAGAITTLARTIARTPSLADAHEMLGRILMEIGRTTAGLACLSTAIALDPMLHYARLEIAREHALCGQWADVEKILDVVEKESEPWVVDLYRIRMALWRREKMQIKVRSDDNASPMAPVLTGVLAGQPLTPAGVEIVRGRAAGGGRRFRLYLGQLLAELAAFDGQTNLVLEEIERAIDGGLSDATWLDRCPLLDLARASDRFPALRAKLARQVAPALEAAITARL